MNIKRIIIYLIGLVVLVLGLTLNTLTSLGASAIVSVPFTVSEVYGLNFGNTTLMLYCIFVLVEIVLDRRDIVMKLMQIPLSIVFTRFMNIFKSVISFNTSYLAFNIIMAFVAIFLTALGIFLTVRMNLIPNPGDGFVSVIADKIGRELGVTKNIVDMTCVIISLAIGSIYKRPFIGIGIGTILSMIFVGRVLSFLNRKFGDLLLSVSGRINNITNI